MKFCKHCKHIVNRADSLAQCGHPKLLKYDLVTGDLSRIFCSTERTGPTDHIVYLCGFDGALFEPKDAQ
jgi:hypothetical protein